MEQDEPEPTGAGDNAADSVTSFVTTLDSHEPRMRRIIVELREDDDKVKTLQFRQFAGFCLLPVAAGYMLFTALATRSLSVVVFALINVGYLIFHLNNKATEEEVIKKVESLVGEFRTHVGSVNAQLENVKTFCVELRKKSMGTAALKLINLEIRILEQMAFNEKLSGPAMLELMDATVKEYEKTLDTFLEIKDQAWAELIGSNVQCCDSHNNSHSKCADTAWRHREA